MKSFILLLSTLTGSWFQGATQNAKPPELVKVQLNTGSSMVGELLDENESDLKLIDLRTGKLLLVKRADVFKATKNLSDKDVIGTVGLAPFFAWRIKSLTKAPKTGKIATVTPQLLYVSLGAKDGCEKGQQLEVFRDRGEVTDPDSGKPLGRELAQIARLEVVDVQQDLSKARQVGDLEVELRVGDVVAPARSEKLVAILPLVNPEGNETVAGRRFSEELTTVLVGRHVRVVERAVLRLEQGRTQKIAFRPGSGWDDTPANTQRAIKESEADDAGAAPKKARSAPK